jgi:alkylated DNA nucleotide flippase Atl1
MKPAATAGRVGHLFLKPRRGGAAVELDCDTPLLCVSALGVAGDVHANRLSPRQILVTLQSQLDELSIVPGALFENMVVALDDPRHFRPGSAIVTAGGVEIRLTMYCEPCKRILPVVADLAQMVGRRGILGYIVDGGAVRRGDAVSVIPGRYAALAESPAQKFRDVVQAIPAGRVLRYLDVTIAMGVDASFARAVPGYIRRSLADGFPVHRIVDRRGRLLEYVPGQAGKLASEGVDVDGGGAVDCERFLWQGRPD